MEGGKNLQTQQKSKSVHSEHAVQWCHSWCFSIRSSVFSFHL